MIVTVTMNPAIDKTVDIDHMERGGLNRILRAEYDVGGKGINVSKTIRELGEKSVATGFIAGSTGETIRKFLEENGIATDFVTVAGETRTNTKVYEKTGELTELNELGPVITEEQMECLMTKLSGYASPDTLFVLAGSVPRGVEKDIYAKITHLVHEKGAEVLMDADGELFTKALEAKPDIIKPNRVELEAYMNMDEQASEEDLIHAGEKLQEKGIKKVAISMGKNGAMFLLEGYHVKCPGLQVKAHSTVGAGDAMVAALAYAWEQKLSPEDTVKTCMASSAGAVTTIGTKPPKRALVDELMAQVEIRNIS